MFPVTTVDHITIDKSPRLRALALKGFTGRDGQSCRPNANAGHRAGKQPAPKERSRRKTRVREATKDSATKDSAKEAIC
jgi:hypothetical protein